MIWSPALIGLRQGPGAVAAGLLLDSITATVKGAYGVRKLRTAYAGACLRVRRSSDNAEQDIGFTAGNDLNTSAMLSFCGTGSGFVSKWYDHSEAGQDLTRTTASMQPQVVDSGVVLALANAAARPAMAFTPPSQTWLSASGFALSGSVVSAHSVASGVGANNRRLLSYAQNGSNDYTGPGSVMFYHWLGSTSLSAYRSAQLSTAGAGAAPFQVSSAYNGTNHVMTVDGTIGSAVASAGAVVTGGTLYTGGSGNPDEWWEGKMAEHLVIAGSLSSADQATIRISQKTYYGTP